MAKIKIAVAGCLGRMGQELSKQITNNNKLEFVGGFEHKKHKDINKKFKDDLDMAQDFYSGNINEIENKKKAKEFCKEVASSNGELKDKEIRFMVRLKKTWGRHIFDS